MASSALRAGERARIRLGVRQKCPDLKNLRDHGLTCVRELLRIVGNLEKGLGCGFALVSEDVLRALYHQDTGHMPGVGTLCAAMRREEERHGLFQVRWIQRGSIDPLGRRAEVGMLRIRLGRGRTDRRAIRKRASELARVSKLWRRENVGGEPCAPVREAEVFEELGERFERGEQQRELAAAEAKAAAEDFLRLFPYPRAPS